MVSSASHHVEDHWEYADSCKVAGPTAQRRSVRTASLRSAYSTLSSRIAWGRPRQATTCSSTRTTRSAGRDVSISMANPFRTPSSSTFSVRKRRPPYSVSLIKSTAETAFGCGITTSGCRRRTGSRFFVRQGRFKWSWQYTRHSRFGFHG